MSLEKEKAKEFAVHACGGACDCLFARLFTSETRVPCDEIWVRDTVNTNFMEGVLLVVVYYSGWDRKAMTESASDNQKSD